MASTQSSTVIKAKIENLRYDCPAIELKSEIQSILRSIGVAVALSQVEVHLNPSEKRAYAFVFLKDQATFDIVVKKLNGFPSIEWKKLISPWKKLEIFADREGLKDGEKHTMVNSPVTMEKERSFYRLGEKLGTENRVTEYKTGGGNYLKFYFQEDLAKYACAFLNSEGGTLLIGVKDDCTVCGVNINVLDEDKLKKEIIDNTMKGFKPQVFTESYSLKFVPVKSPQHDTHKAMQPYLKVIEFKFQPGEGLSSLYVNQNEEVYIKRDGSVQGPLKPSQILEWSKPKIYHSVKTLFQYQYEERLAELKEKELNSNNNATDHSSSQTNNHNSAKVNEPDHHPSLPKEDEEENKKSKEVEDLLQKNYALEREIFQLRHELTTAFKHDLTPNPEVCADIEAIVSFFEAKDKDNYSIESELELPTPTPAFYAYMKKLVRDEGCTISK